MENKEQGKPVKLIAAKKQLVYRADGVPVKTVEAGETFSLTDPEQARRLVEQGAAHYPGPGVAMADTKPPAPASEPVKAIPLVTPVTAKVDGRTKAGKANKGKRGR